MVRKVVFWGHLTAGLVAGVFVLMMSVTGVLLTYESQIVHWATARAIEAPAGAVALSPEEIVAATGAVPGQSLVLPREPGGLVELRQGRSSVALDPYSGTELDGAGDGVAAFFRSVTALHRWLSFSGPTEVGGWLVDAANLLFLGLVVSGLYLWLPKTWKWRRVKMNLVFRRGLPNAQARDYNWHHVLGFWALVPLFVIVLTGVIMSYGWANAALFAALGEEVPQGRGRGAVSQEFAARKLSGAPLGYAALLDAAGVARPDWTTAAIVLPETGAGAVQVTLDGGNGVAPAQRSELVLDRATGEILSEDAVTGSAGMRARMWARFAHTGQYYGIIGQTVAGLASLAAMVLVWTGMALGLRRLLRMRRLRRAAV